MAGKYFADGNAPNIIDLSETGQHAMAQCRALGYSIEYTRAGIHILYPPPSNMQAFAYSLEDFLEIARDILASHAVELSKRQPTENESLSDEAHRESVGRLVALSRKAIEQRDAWKSRALAAERELASLRAQASRSDGEGRYGKLKRIIAQELHPDNQVGATAKLVRAEIFKVVWSKVQDIDKEG